MCLCLYVCAIATAVQSLLRGSCGSQTGRSSTRGTCNFQFPYIRRFLLEVFQAAIDNSHVFHPLCVCLPGMSVCHVFCTQSADGARDGRVILVRFVSEFTQSVRRYADTRLPYVSCVASAKHSLSLLLYLLFVMFVCVVCGVCLFILNVNLRFITQNIAHSDGTESGTTANFTAEEKAKQGVCVCVCVCVCVVCVYEYMCVNQYTCVRCVSVSVCTCVCARMCVLHRR